MNHGSKIPNFTGSPECASRAHCRACRTVTAWRISAGAPDDCPHGVSIDDLPEIRNPGAIAARRLAICAACDNTGCGIKHQTDCRARAILGRENFQCPRGRFRQTQEERMLT